MALTLPPDKYDLLNRFVVHVAMCRACTARGGTVPGLRGCATGHMLAVRASLVIRDQMRSGGIVPDGRGQAS